MDFAITRRVLGLIACVALGAPAAIAQTASPARLEAFPDTPRGHASQPLPEAVFPETQRRLLMTAHLDRAHAGRTVSVQIDAVRTTLTAPERVYEGRGPVGPTGQLPITVTLQRNWPVGHYTVSISADGQPTVTLPYRVEPTSPRIGAITVERFQLDRLVAAGRFEPANPARAADRNLFLVAHTRGSRTDGARVTWVLVAVETTAGTAEVIRLNTLDRFLDDTPLQFNLSLPRDWPAGRYRADLLIDGRRIAAHDFRIEP